MLPPAICANAAGVSASSKASTETQLPPFVKFIQKIQGQCEVWLLELLSIAQAYLSLWETGVAAADERLRVQAVLDSRNSQLLLNLLDMRDGGEQGEAVTAAANSDYVLQGFSGSAVEFIYITVADLAGLISLAQDNYSSRLVDILDIRTS